MSRKAAIALALIMLGIVAWGFFLEAGSTRIIVNGHEITGPLKGAVGVAGLIVGLIALFCGAIFLLFVFAGVGVFVLGGLMLVGLIWTAWSMPFVLVVLLPLAIVWLFIAITRQGDS